jgi:hypothetical protein
MVSEVRTAFPVYAVEKVFLPTCTTDGVKIFWKQARRSILQEIPPERPVPMKWWALKRKRTFKTVANGDCSYFNLCPLATPCGNGHITK